mmetsp:Transcript_35562/g.92715  ORF Transcript_35562/g.92715 Transcript_35562/m.92715 type:complete len:181 (+) Transcript_35562:70-612(+)
MKFVKLTPNAQDKVVSFQPKEAPKIDDKLTFANLPKLEGYNEDIVVSASSKSKKKADPKELEMKKDQAWGVLKQSGQAFFGTAFMLYMGGNQFNIFSIMILGMSIRTIIMSLMNVNATFSRFGEGVLEQKLAFIVMQLAFLSFPLYKVFKMGIIPVTAADWVGSMRFTEYEESVIGGVIG